MISLIINGINLADYGVYSSQLESYTVPEREYETITIPGRNGDLTVDKGRYKSLPLSYKSWIANNFKFNVNAFRGLYAYLASRPFLRIEESISPDYYRIGKLSGELAQDVYAHLASEFELKFVCEPERWLKSGEEFKGVRNGAVLASPTLFNSEPKIRLYGSGSITIGDSHITVSDGADEYVELDCHRHIAYEALKNRNSLVTLDKWATIEPTDTQITYTGFSKVEIAPRWRDY